MLQDQTKGKQTQASGISAWLIDIEVNKVAYIASLVMLLLNIILVRLPFFEISVMGISRKYALAEIPGLSDIPNVVAIINAALFIKIYYPMLQFFEWKYHRFVPVLVLSAIEACGFLCILAQRENILIRVLDLLNVEIKLTFSAWASGFIIAAMIACMVKILLDIKRNEEARYKFLNFL
ncbi:MAG: hypothetical protein IJ375_06000 [Oscillospiraceae bacterium]|nr:hypothetical protein [Oscillospiraceae bacterium]